ncbi:tyrosyl-DNA phosphodiesterase 1 [Phlyctochytrium planicorne]|nr:tyrosyl-DNA phosphodiesterase 1 [Phlyctochytrium planicorne]
MTMKRGFIELTESGPSELSKKKVKGEGPDASYLNSNVKLVKVHPIDRPEDNIETTSLTELLGGDIDICYQFNYQLDLEFFFANVPTHNLDSTFHFIVHPLKGLREMVAQLGFANCHFVFPQVEMYGTHHTKAMIIFYKNDTARVVIHTANLVQKDWGKKSQGCWVSDILSKKSQANGSYISSDFESDLLAYLTSYGRPLEDLRALVKQYDFSNVRAAIVGSVPGRHSEHNKFKWGHLRMRNLLSEVPLSTRCRRSSSIVLQFSSIGSLGNTNKWLVDEFGASLSRTSTSGLMPNPPLKIVFPTVEEVRDSNQGWSAGRSIPHNEKNWNDHSSYLRPLLHRWKGNLAGRNDSMPHIKTFARVNEDSGDLSWLYIGSHNLSKAAWGTLQSNGAKLYIRSYELGVLLHPTLFKKSIPEAGSSMVLFKNVVPSTLANITFGRIRPQTDIVVPIRLPYDLPLTPYRLDQDPWRWDVAFPGFDSQGQTIDE